MIKNQIQLKQLTLASMFTALGVILASPVFAYMILLFGVPAVRVDLIAIPIILAGILLGPIYGMTVGIAVDILGFFLFTSVFGAYHAGFTLNLALTGLIAGGVMKLFNKRTFKMTLLPINIAFLSVLSVAGIVYLLVTDEISINGNPYLLSGTFKAIFILSIVLFFAILLFSMLYPRLKKHKAKPEIDVVLFIVLLIEVFVVILLTPIWVEDLYGAPPYMAGVFVRVIRAMWLIPIKAYLVYYIWYVARVTTGAIETSPRIINKVEHK